MRTPPPAPDEAPRRPRRRFHPLRFFRRLLTLILCLAVAFLAVRFGPNLYRRFFGDGNTRWVSERFGEELKTQNELVVYQATITGQETVSQEAWLLGTVQQVVVPYSYAISFSINLNQAQVDVDTASDTLIVRLPSPLPGYSKLTVDEDQMQKNDWLYPLTPERYSEIKSEIEQKLYDECSTNQTYLDAAWDSAVDNMEKLFTGISATSRDGVTCTIQVVRDDSLAVQATDASTDLEVSGEPTATPKAA